MPLRNTVVVPVSSLHRGVVSALAYANAIAPGNVTAVHVSLDDEQTAKLSASGNTGARTFRWW
jgi:hypothetical protein